MCEVQITVQKGVIESMLDDKRDKLCVLFFDLEYFTQGLIRIIQPQHLPVGPFYV